MYSHWWNHTQTVYTWPAMWYACAVHIDMLMAFNYCVSYLWFVMIGIYQQPPTAVYRSVYLYSNLEFSMLDTIVYFINRQLASCVSCLLLKPDAKSSCKACNNFLGGLLDKISGHAALMFGMNIGNTWTHVMNLVRRCSKWEQYSSRHMPERKDLVY